MRYWLREIAGWLLVAIGLLAFYACYAMLMGGQVVSAGAFTVVGIFIFRGGIHLLKMAVAAQICMEAQNRAEHQSTQSFDVGDAVRRPVRSSSRPSISPRS